MEILTTHKSDTISIEHITIFLSKYISKKGAIKMKLPPNIGNNISGD